ncbi:hypothetical protein ACFLYB_03915 [Chloroflexota bacterium]
MAGIKSIAIALMATVVLVLTGAAGCGQDNDIEIYTPPQTTTQAQIGQIYIGSGVNNPGYYPLKEGDTIDGLIRAAGGLAQGVGIDNIDQLFVQPTEENKEQKININTAPAYESSIKIDTIQLGYLKYFRIHPTQKLYMADRYAR